MKIIGWIMIGFLYMCGFKLLYNKYYKTDKVGFEKFLCRTVVKIIKITKNEKTAQFWCWEMTPMPIGLPFWQQYINGIKLAFNIKIKKQEK